MKSSPLLLLASAGLALAHPDLSQHNHKRFHELKARQQDATKTNTIMQEATVAVYMLDGNSITDEELWEGIRNGTLVLGSGAPMPQPSQTTPSTTQAVIPAYTAPASSSAPAPAPTSASPSPSPSPSPSTQVSSPSPASSAAAAPSAASYSGSSSSSGSGSSSGSTAGVNRAYDNSLDCSEFPTSFGALPLNYLGLGGWTGIQTPGAGSSASGLTNIETSGSCKEGSYCSYACPPGTLKSQWPTTQGSTGQSVGGLLCKNGKLTLTRPEVSQLCISGAAQVSVSIQNKLSKNVAVCRTDYPGTESMVIPLNVSPGQTQPLACPDGGDYYEWQGKPTSAQYYVNNAGVSVEDGCLWGSSGNPTGNWAPLNLGVGYSNGAAWLGIMQNAPTSTAHLNFKITIQGDNGVTCVYQNGQYNGNSNGCTVSVSQGQATYIFEDA